MAERAGRLRDKDGNKWASFVNQYQQRMLRCTDGPRKGEEVHDPRLGQGGGQGISTRDPMRPPRDPWREALETRPFWE